MIDSLIIKVKSGDGGKGSVSFNKDSNNSRGGPDVLVLIRIQIILEGVLMVETVAQEEM